MTEKIWCYHNEFDEEKTVCDSCKEILNEGITDDREIFHSPIEVQGPCEVCEPTILGKLAWLIKTKNVIKPIITHEPHMGYKVHTVYGDTLSHPVIADAIDEAWHTVREQDTLL